jgi:hypothetical protein
MFADFLSQAALQEESRRTVDESVRQREHLINELELKFNQETEKLKELHDKELEQLEQQLEKGKINEQIGAD